MAMAFGEDAYRVMIARGFERAADRSATALAIDDDVPVVNHRVADHRDAEQLLLCDETGAAGDVREYRENVEEALMIADQYERFEAAQILQSLDLDRDSAGADDRPCPPSAEPTYKPMEAEPGAD